MQLSAASKITFLLQILFLFIKCCILSLIFITCISQKEQRNTIIWHPNTKSPAFSFKFCWSILQFSCFFSKNTTAKVKHETSFQKSLKQFLLKIRESQRCKSYYFETVKEEKVTEKSEYMPNCLELNSKDWYIFRIQLQVLILKPPPTHPPQE